MSLVQALSGSCCVHQSTASSTPRFLESRDGSDITRASKIIYKNRSSIVLIKAANPEWGDENDSSIGEDEGFSTVTATSSLEVNVGSATNSADCVTHRPSKGSVTFSEHFDVKSAHGCQSLCLCGDPKQLDESRSSVYAVAGQTKIRANPLRPSHSKLLDWMTTCFWKCSSGCHQIPDFDI